MQANGVASSAANAPTVERLERDEGALTDEQRMSAVMADAPELAALLSELQGSLAEVRSHVGPVLKEVRVRHAVAVMLHLLLCCCVALKAKRGQCACYRKVQYALCVCTHTGKCALCFTSSRSCSCNCHLLAVSHM